MPRGIRNGPPRTVRAFFFASLASYQCSFQSGKSHSTTLNAAKLKTVSPGPRAAGRAARGPTVNLKAQPLA
eukprot:499379-Hanusia_phi.AAC.1